MNQSAHASFANLHIDEETKDEAIRLNLRPETLDQLEKQIKNSLNDNIPMEMVIEDL